jgi:hypothetical protein
MLSCGRGLGECELEGELCFINYKSRANSVGDGRGDVAQVPSPPLFAGVGHLDPACSSLLEV